MIRIIRVLEYEFEDDEKIEHYLTQLMVPIDGVKNFGIVKIRSSGIIDMSRVGETDAG